MQVIVTVQTTRKLTPQEEKEWRGRSPADKQRTVGFAQNALMNQMNGLDADQNAARVTSVIVEYREELGNEHPAEEGSEVRG